MSDRHAIWWRTAIVLASAAVFAKCLTRIAFVVHCCSAEGSTDVYGFDLLTLGWAGVLGSPLHPPLFVSIIGAWACACAENRLATVIWTLFAAAVMAAYAILGFDNAGYMAWLANPVIVVAWYFYLSGRRPAAFISAVLALGLTLTFLSVAAVPLDHKMEPVTILSYGKGYWLWIASAAILAAGVSIDMVLFRRSSTAATAGAG